MSVRMAARFTLVLLLVIHRVCGQYGYGVNYGSVNICALQGSTVTMSCTYRYPYGSHVVRAFWTKTRVKDMYGEYPDLSVDPEYSQRLQYLGDKQQNCHLRLSHVTKKDEREYYCRFTINTNEKWIGTPGVRLSVTDLQLESPERVTEGDSVRLTCRSSCKLTDTPTFIWYRNSETFTTSTGNELSVGPVSRGHADNYSCGVQGNYYLSPAVYLNVRYAPDPPVISISGSAVIVEGDSVTLSCSSDSNPPAEISWFKGETSVGSGRIFSISNISSDDSGEYNCRARNEHGVKYSDPVTLDVQFRQGAERNRIVMGVACGGLFIVILLFIIRMKRMNSRSAVNEYENVGVRVNTYAALDLQSRSSDLYNTLTTPSPAVHQTSSSIYANLPVNGRSAVDLH